MRNFVHCSLSVVAFAGLTFGQAPVAGPSGTARAGDPVRQAGVGLGKIPGPTMNMMVTLGSGPMKGRLERAAPAGSTLTLQNDQGRVVSQAPVNADGSFQFPASQVPLQNNFTTCLQSPGVAPICSAQGALSALSVPWRDIGDLKKADRVAASPRPAEVAAIPNVLITQLPNGTWKCTSVGGKPCSNPEVQATTTVIKSRSNVKENSIAVAPDGTLSCTNAADGKPCSPAVMNQFMNEMKAVTKGGSTGF